MTRPPDDGAASHGGPAQDQPAVAGAPWRASFEMRIGERAWVGEAEGVGEWVEVKGLPLGTSAFQADSADGAPSAEPDDAEYPRLIWRRCP